LLTDAYFVACQVNKQLLLLNIDMDAGADLDSPACLSQCTVREMASSLLLLQTLFRICLAGKRVRDGAASCLSLLLPAGGREDREALVAKVMWGSRRCHQEVDQPAGTALGSGR
jgi:hypothetical protein